jgi:23S rRNA U2552 (ribose-2'-O)-methylase RlmE/FtsJ
MSDMAVNTTGIKNIDSIQTGELCKEAMIFSKDILKIMVSLFQKFLWEEHLMKLSH